MTRLKFDVKVKKNLTQQVKHRVVKSVQESTKIVAEDLARTSSGATPHETGDLEGSYSIEYQTSSGKSTATIEYSVYHLGFNYALAMHEWSYELGEGSLQKGGGTGMSGTTYPVGNKFLTRVLTGEAKAYTKYYESKIKKAIGG